MNYIYTYDIYINLYVETSFGIWRKEKIEHRFPRSP